MGIGVLDVVTVFSEREGTLCVHRSASNTGDCDTKLTIARETGERAVATCDELEKKQLACNYERDKITHCLLEQVQAFIFGYMQPKVGREQEESRPEHTTLVIHNQAARKYISENGRENANLIGSQKSSSRSGGGSRSRLQNWLRFGVRVWTRS